MARKDESGKKRSNRTKGRKRAPLGLADYRRMYALSKKERVRILAILVERVASPKELAAELNEGLSQVSYHVGVLRECRLIKLVDKKPRRGAVEHFYEAAIPSLTASTPVDELPPLGLLRQGELSGPVLLAVLPLAGGPRDGRKGSSGKGSR